MTTDYINARERYRRVKPVETPTHKFQVGVVVAYRPSPTGERGHFKVTRHLPDGGQGKSDRSHVVL